MKKRIFLLAMLVLCVAGNFLGSLVARHLTVPLYLDSVFTIAMTALGGLWLGVLCAVLSNGTLFLIDGNMIPFTFCHILTALLAHLTFRQHQKINGTKSLEIDTFLWAGIWSAASNALFGNIISETFFSSNTVENVNNAVQGIFIAVPNLTYATYFSGILTNLADKTLSAALSFALYALCAREALINT